jgi:ubiquinone/menaquinone biosynthesis C-methylase UbiE
MIGETSFREEEIKWKANFAQVYDALDFHTHLESSKKHLDFGCGVGIFPYSLAKIHPNIFFYAIDKDEELIAYAKEKYALPNLYFEIAPKEQRYSSVSAIFVLHHIKDYKTTLQNINRMLPKGGLLLVMEFKKTPKEKFRKYHDDLDTKEFDKYYRTHNRWTKKQFESACKSAGFETISIDDFGEFLFSYVGEKK